MRISEIFYSIRGEGMLAGVPSVFVRTSGCNLRCTWCDTPYASWNPEGEEWPVEALLEKISEWPARHCVVTGGEPMIAPGVADLCAGLRARGMHVTIETAGTIAPSGIPCDLASISPKLSNSTPTVARAGEGWVGRHEKARLRPEVLAAWVDAGLTQFKFVVRGGEDLPEVESVLLSIGWEIPRDRVLLMPEGIEREILEERGRTIARLCMERGFRYCPRLHIALYGNQRGT